MENILDIIEGINNMSYESNISFTRNTPDLSTFDVNSLVNNISNTQDYISNFCEYVDNLTSAVTNISNMYNTDEMSENISNFEEIYNTSENMDIKNIHSQNTSNIADYSNINSNFVDKSENFADNGYYLAENPSFFHNNSDFKEIYNFVDNLSKGDTTTQNTNTSTSSNININLGGVTQNITETNCDKVLQELSDVLIRSLSGCDGIY